MRHLTGHKLCLLQWKGGVYNCCACGQRKTKRASPPELNYSCASPAPGAQTISPHHPWRWQLQVPACLVIALALLAFSACSLSLTSDQRDADRVVRLCLLTLFLSSDAFVAPRLAIRVVRQGAELKFNEYGWNKGVHACFLNLCVFFMLKVSYICLKHDSKTFFVIARG